MELLLVLLIIPVAWFLLMRRRRASSGMGGFTGAAIIAVLFIVGWVGYRAMVGPESQRADYAAGDTALRALLEPPSATP